MVIDTIDNLEKYATLNPLFKDVVEFIKANDLNTLEEGKHFIKDKDLFVNIQTAKGKTKQEAKLETHKRMIDIQIPLSAEETFGYTPLCNLPEEEYNEEERYHEIRYPRRHISHMQAWGIRNILPARRPCTMRVGRISVQEGYIQSAGMTPAYSGTMRGG